MQATEGIRLEIAEAENRGIIAVIIAICAEIRSGSLQLLALLAMPTNHGKWGHARRCGVAAGSGCLHGQQPVPYPQRETPEPAGGEW